jgi:hypothetical protein
VPNLDCMKYIASTPLMKYICELAYEVHLVEACAKLRQREYFLHREGFSLKYEILHFHCKYLKNVRGWINARVVLRHSVPPLNKKHKCQ